MFFNFHVLTFRCVRRGDETKDPPVTACCLLSLLFTLQTRTQSPSWRRGMLRELAHDTVSQYEYRRTVRYSGWTLALPPHGSAPNSRGRRRQGLERDLHQSLGRTSYGEVICSHRRTPEWLSLVSKPIESHHGHPRGGRVGVRACAQWHGLLRRGGTLICGPEVST